MLSKVIFVEWPLVFFTIFVQGALGLSLAYALFSTHEKSVKNDDVIKKYVAIFGITVFIGLFFAVLHLSNPINGYNILFRIFYEVNESMYIGWLPLEVLVLGFTSFVAAFIYYLMYKGKNQELAKKLVNVLPLLAFVGLICMVFIYSSKSSTVLVWTFKYTFLLFITTSLVLGPLFFLVVFKDLSKDTVNKATYALIVGYILFLAVQLFNVYNLANTFIVGVESAFDLAYGYYFPILLIGIVVTSLPVARISFLTLVKNRIPHQNCIRMSFALAFFGMVCIRILFYAINNVHMFH